MSRSALILTWSLIATTVALVVASQVVDDKPLSIVLAVAALLISGTAAIRHWNRHFRSHAR